MRFEPYITRYAPLTAVRRLCDPQLDRWLTSAELAELFRINDRLRRDQWIGGRWLGKQLVNASALSQSFEILSRSTSGLGTRPQVFTEGVAVSVSLSISHTDQGVMVGIARGGDRSIGVDLACGVPSDPRFLRQWFTESEQRWVAGSPRLRTELLWTLKEAFFKAGNTGQPWTPRQVEIIRDASGFHARIFGNRTVAEQVTVQRVDGQLAATVVLANESMNSPRSGEWVSCL